MANATWAWLHGVFLAVPDIAHMEAEPDRVEAFVDATFGNGRRALVVLDPFAAGRYALAVVDEATRPFEVAARTDAKRGLDDAGVIDALREIAALPVQIGA